MQATGNSDHWVTLLKVKFEQQKSQNISELRTFTRTLNKFKVFLEMATLQVVDFPAAKFGIHAVTFSERILGQLVWGEAGKSNVSLSKD